jgi:dephospho-CoA kinase
MLREVTKIIGLTGPIGSGKNEVARILRRRGAFVIEADEVAHALYKDQTPAWHGLVRVFGSKVLNRGGRVNRRKLGEIVFSDKRKLALLNRIVHPYLREAIVQEIKKTRHKARGKRPQAQGIIVINAAVLKEIGLVDYVDEVWVVMASRAGRLRRLLKMGLVKKEADARLRLQMSQKEYLKIADVVIQNEGSLRSLKKKVLSLL